MVCYRQIGFGGWSKVNRLQPHLMDCPVAAGVLRDDIGTPSQALSFESHDTGIERLVSQCDIPLHSVGCLLAFSKDHNRFML